MQSHVSMPCWCQTLTSVGHQKNMSSIGNVGALHTYTDNINLHLLLKIQNLLDPQIPEKLKCNPKLYYQQFISTNST